MDENAQTLPAPYVFHAKYITRGGQLVRFGGIDEREAYYTDMHYYFDFVDSKGFIVCGSFGNSSEDRQPNKDDIVARVEDP